MRIKIEGLGKLKKAIETQLKRCEEFNQSSAIVGYGTHYGIYVHEDLQKVHKTGKAKYLTDAEKEVRDEYVKQIGEDLRKREKNDSLECSNVFNKACDTIRQKSVTLVPIDTGQLKDSAFNREDPIYGDEGSLMVGG